MVKYSFPRKTTEIKEENNLIILNNSKIIRWVLTVYKAWKERTISYSRESTFVKLIKKIYFLPVKTVSIIIVPIILINIFFFIIFNQKIGFSGWIIRVLFLFIGWGGLFCNADWATIKESSIVFKYINNTCKIRD